MYRTKYSQVLNQPQLLIFNPLFVSEKVEVQGVQAQEVQAQDVQVQEFQAIKLVKKARPLVS